MRRFVKLLIFIFILVFFNTACGMDKSSVSATVNFDISSNYYFWVRLKTDEKQHRLQLYINNNLINEVMISKITRYQWILIASNVPIQSGSHHFEITIDKPVVLLDKFEISLDVGYYPNGLGSSDEVKTPSQPEKILEIPLQGKGGYVMFADFDNDHSIDYLITGEQFVSVYTNAGNLLWEKNFSGKQHPNCGWGFFFRPYDIDHDGNVEAIGPIDVNDSLFLAVLKGQTGAIKAKYFLPDYPSNFGYESSQIANFDGDHYSKFITVKLSDSVFPYQNFKFFAFKYQNKEILPFWTFERSNAGKGICHRPVVYDIDQDGKDEALLGHWALDENGKVLWEKVPTFFDQWRHVDSIRPADILPDHQGIEIMISSGFIMLDPDGNVIWRKNVGYDVQSIAIEDFRRDIPGLEILTAVQAPDNDEYLLTATGEILWSYNGPSEYDASFETTPIQWIGDSQKEVIEQRYGRGRVISLYDEYGKIIGDIDPSFQYGEVNYKIADVFGDFREEIVFFNSNHLIVYTNGAVNQYVGESPWKNEEYQKKQYNWVYY